MSKDSEYYHRNRDKILAARKRYYQEMKEDKDRYFNFRMVHTRYMTKKYREDPEYRAHKLEYARQWRLRRKMNIKNNKSNE